MNLSKISTIISWMLAILLAFAYLAAAVGKLTGAFTQAFVHWGYPAWFATLIGVLELAGAIGLLIPKTLHYAVLGLTVIMLGAVYTHLANHEGLQVLQPVIFLALLWVVWGLRRVARHRARAATAV